MGFPRLESAQQVELLPQLFSSLSGKPQQHQDSLIYLGLPAIMLTNLTTEALKQPFQFLQENSELSSYINEFLLDMLLLPYG